MLGKELLSFSSGLCYSRGSNDELVDGVGVTMKKPINWRQKRLPALALLGLLSGCGEEAPPYDVLPLRDTLQANPEVIAALPLDTRREIARRFQEAGLDGVEATEVELPRDLGLDSIAFTVDETRDALDRDALILGEVETKENTILVHLQNVDESQLGGFAPMDSLVWRGLPEAPTASVEETALRGRAGQLLEELSKRSGSSQWVRITHLPLGAWAKDEKLYVNASWLVAMAALEDGVVQGNAGPQFVFYGEQPGKTPLTVDFNPYNLPESLLQCWDQVETTCQCGTSCDHEVTDPTFANAVEECAWVNSDPANGAILCVLALLSNGDIRECVASGLTCPVTRVSSREDAIRFLSHDTCVNFLDICLQDGFIPRPVNDSGNSGGSTSGNCGGCDTDCGGCGTTCSQCNEDCAECNQNWEDCNQNCEDCNQNYEDTKNCSKCSMEPRVIRPSNAGPLSTTFWLTAPMVYVLVRSRRRARVKRSQS